MNNPDAWHKANPSMEYMPILANQIHANYLEMKELPSKETRIHDETNELAGKK